MAWTPWNMFGGYGMSDGRIVYWDSCVFIDRIQATPGTINVLRGITDRAENGAIRIATSLFTMCEVAKVAGVPLEEDLEQMIVDFFDNEFIVPVPLDHFVAAKVREIIRATTRRLSSADAVHIASAIIADASALHTYDGDHLLPLDGVFEGLPIKEPRIDNLQLPLLPPGETG